MSDVFHVLLCDIDEDFGRSAPASTTGTNADEYVTDIASVGLPHEIKNVLLVPVRGIMTTLHIFAGTLLTTVEE